MSPWTNVTPGSRRRASSSIPGVDVPRDVVPPLQMDEMATGRTGHVEQGRRTGCPLLDEGVQGICLGLVVPCPSSRRGVRRRGRCGGTWVEFWAQGRGGGVTRVRAARALDPRCRSGRSDRPRLLRGRAVRRDPGRVARARPSAVVLLRVVGGDGPQWAGRGRSARRAGPGLGLVDQPLTLGATLRDHRLHPGAVRLARVAEPAQGGGSRPWGGHGVPRSRQAVAAPSQRPLNSPRPPVWHLRHGQVLHRRASCHRRTLPARPVCDHGRPGPPVRRGPAGVFALSP